MRILIVERELAVQNLLKNILNKRGHKPIIVDKLSSVHETAASNHLDAILLDLDLCLSNGKGTGLCSELRNQSITAPILILSDKNDTNLKVECLNAGADDYVIKPFEDEELMARLNAMNRRSSGSNGNSIVRVGGLSLNKLNRSITINDHEVQLTNHEIDLLAYLMEREGEIISKDKLSKDIWGISHQTPSNFINVYISYIRNKIRTHSSRKYIKTIRNKGYVFDGQNGKS